MIYTIATFLIHFTVNLGWGDDAGFGKFLGQYNSDMMSYVTDRYHTWTSRLIIEPFLIIIVHMQNLWRLLDTAIMLLIAVSISKLIPTTNKRKTNWIITCLMFMYPYGHMATAGWITTTMNYSWPLAFGLFSMLPIKKIIFKEKIKWYEYIFYTASILFALNQEQMCVIILAVYSVFTIYFILKKKPVLYMILQSIIGISSLIFILTSPGNYVRKLREVTKWFPEYPNISFIRKIEMGYSSSLFQFIMKPNITFTVFSGLLLLCVIITNKNRLFRWISAIPFISSLAFGLFSSVLAETFPIITYVQKSMTKFGTGIKIMTIRSWIPDIIITLVLVSIIFSLYIIFKNKKYSILTIFIVLLGLGSRMIMAFSPTIWASSSRTFIFMYFAFIICSIILYQIIMESKETKYAELCTNAIGLIAVISFLNLFAETKIHGA